MNLDQIEFGSILAYCPRGDSPREARSRQIMLMLKNDQFVRSSKFPDTPTLMMSSWIARTVREEMDKLPFGHFFQSNTVLIPTPKTSLMRPDTLWVPDRIANALKDEGIGIWVIRIKAMRKAALSQAKDRPTALDQYNSMVVDTAIARPEEILLVDDIVTRGATLLGAANRLADAYPGIRIRAFVAMRTQSKPSVFSRDYGRCIGTIKLLANGGTLRRP